MLQFLRIKNIALIKELNLEFDAGLNILSGETGAGKSIIIDSLNFLLGAKNDKSLIRHGESKMEAEGVFYCGEDTRFLDALQEIGIEPEDNLIIYRSFNIDSKSDIRINGRAVSLSSLKTITTLLADIYGQSEHISLLNKDTHLHIIDSFGKAIISDYKINVANYFNEYKDILKNIKSLGGSAEDRARQIDLYTYQINEIESANLKADEEEVLKATLLRFSNIERISEDLSFCNLALNGDEGNAIGLISSVCSALSRASKYDNSISNLSERLNSVRIELEDVSQSVYESLNSLDYDEVAAQKVESRLELIKGLKRKYGSSVEAILDYCSKSKSELDKLLNSEKLLEEAEYKKQICIKKLYDNSAKLSEIRRDISAKLEEKVKSSLNDLSMKGTEFKVFFNEIPKIEESEKYFTSLGFDFPEFLISPNIGEPLKPLGKIISGGEMSRLMLAIKSINADSDSIGTLVFDEIDTGISGLTATAVAKKLADISRVHQVIAITHLPQIASMGDKNYSIKKSSQNNSTITEIFELDEKGKTDEIARLVGSSDISEHATLHAEKLVSWSDEYKKINLGNK